MQVLEQENSGEVFIESSSGEMDNRGVDLGRIELEEVKSKLFEVKMCEEMLRKDFELLRIHNIFSLIFSDVDFFSKPNDDLISIEHTIQISHKKAKDDFHRDYFNHMYECGCQLAFTNGVGTAEEKAKFLASLMFQASTFIKDFEGISFFLMEFMKSYPQIELPWAKIFLSEATADNWTSL